MASHVPDVLYHGSNPRSTGNRVPSHSHIYQEIEPDVMHGPVSPGMEIMPHSCDSPEPLYMNTRFHSRAAASRHASSSDSHLVRHHNSEPYQFSNEGQPTTLASGYKTTSLPTDVCYWSPKSDTPEICSTGISSSDLSSSLLERSIDVDLPDSPGGFSVAINRSRSDKTTNPESFNDPHDPGAVDPETVDHPGFSSSTAQRPAPWRHFINHNQPVVIPPILPHTHNVRPVDIKVLKWLSCIEDPLLKAMPDSQQARGHRRVPVIAECSLSSVPSNMLDSSPSSCWTRPLPRQPNQRLLPDQSDRSLSSGHRDITPKHARSQRLTRTNMTNGNIYYDPPCGSTAAGSSLSTAVSDVNLKQTASSSNNTATIPRASSTPRLPVVSTDTRQEAQSGAVDTTMLSDATAFMEKPLVTGGVAADKLSRPVKHPLLQRMKSVNRHLQGLGTRRKTLDVLAVL